jgi:Tfp pilus assembly protein PilZ
MSKERRSHIRTALMSHTVIFEYGGESHTGYLFDITKKGTFLDTDISIPPKATVKLILELPGDLGTLPVTANVVRVNWAATKNNPSKKKGVGLEFAYMSEGSTKILEALVTYLRNKTIISVSKRIMEEFYDSKGPRKF